MINLKGQSKKLLGVLCCAVVIAVSVLTPSVRSASVDLLEKITVASLALSVPCSDITGLIFGDEQEETVLQAEKNIEDIQHEQAEPSTVSPEVGGTAAYDNALLLSEEEALEYLDGIPESDRGVINTEMLGKGGANLIWENVYVKNITQEHTVNIEKELEKGTDIRLENTSEPQVLIMHTHTTEGYQTYDVGYYDKSDNTRSGDENANVVRVGARIAEVLNSNGIVTLHDSTVHDSPSYNGAYSRSRVVVEEYLQEYPSIKVVLDIHRDAIESDDGTKTKPTVDINGKKAAQIMIISGCEEGDVTDYPDWQYNLRFALTLQQAFEDTYPGLARPLYFAPRFYNQDLTHGSLLIEMGAEANTLSEAVYSAELVGDVLSDVFKRLTE